jgi:hypothetical protein
MSTTELTSTLLSVSVREDLREGNLLIGVADLNNDKGDYVTFVDRPAVVADASRGDEYLVLLEDGRIVVADSIDLDFGASIDG